MNNASLKQKIARHQQRVAACTLCKAMQPPSVVGAPVVSKVLLVGQAPGDKEPRLQRPFAWTAGKTLFKWFAGIGLDEDAFRQKVYMAAVCRCFPGKNPKGGDRVPSPQEIQRCAQWLHAEIDMLQPKLLIPVGKLAITQYLACNRLVEVIGKSHRIQVRERMVDVVPLPHPSGASTWHRTEPGKGLLNKALGLIANHPAWQQLI